MVWIYSRIFFSTSSLLFSLSCLQFVFWILNKLSKQKNNKSVTTVLPQSSWSFTSFRTTFSGTLRFQSNIFPEYIWKLWMYSQPAHNLKILTSYGWVFCFEYCLKCKWPRKGIIDSSRTPIGPIWLHPNNLWAMKKQHRHLRFVRVTNKFVSSTISTIIRYLWIHYKTPKQRHPLKWQNIQH